MQRWLTARGVPESRIIMEEKSMSTQENLLFTRELLAQRGIGPQVPMAVVTNAFHAYRACTYARALGYADVRSLPAGMDMAMLVPSCLREVLALLDLWVFQLPRLQG